MDDQPKPIGFLSCFFPAYNEEENVGPLLDEALGTVPRFADRFELVVVDDGSSDGTARVVREYAERHPEVRLEGHETNQGYGGALRTGLRSCRGDAVFFTDADRQFRLDDIQRLLPAFDGAGMVAGYRLKRNDPWHRLVVAWVYHRVLHLFFHVGVRDVDCAFKLIRREALDAVLPELESRSAFISPELIIRMELAGFRVSEVGVAHYPRAAGRPKGATPKVIWRTVREIARMRRSLGRGAKRRARAR